MKTNKESWTDIHKKYPTYCNSDITKIYTEFVDWLIANNYEPPEKSTK